MSARAQAKKVQGVVIDGRVRDLSEHRSMEFPVSFRAFYETFYSSQSVFSSLSLYVFIYIYIWIWIYVYNATRTNK